MHPLRDGRRALGIGLAFSHAEAKTLVALVESAAAYGAHAVRPAPGRALLLVGIPEHNVTPVTRGARIASFFWMQSMIRDDGERTLLFDLDTAIQRLTVDLPDHPAVVQLTAVYHNLLRRWANV